MAVNDLSIKIDSGDETVTGHDWSSALLISVDKDPYELINKAVASSARLSGTSKKLADKRVPKSLDYFGWCSWDAFYSAVSPKGLFQGVQSLKKGLTPPKFIIIDDGWQQTDLDSYARGNWVHSQEFIEAESKTMKQAMKYMTEGSSAGATFQSLIEIGKTRSDISLHELAAEHERLSAQRSQDPSNQTWIPWSLVSKTFQKALGSATGIFQGIFIRCYEYCVDPAPNGSLYFHLFSKLAHGPLKTSILSMIADETNFSRRLTDVSANAKFTGSNWESGGLKQVVAHLRNDLEVDFVICWHGLSAYWSGISTDSEPMQKFAPHNVTPHPTQSILDVEPSMKWNPTTLAGMGAIYDPYHLFSQMHKYLSDCDISGVKVDCQAGVTLVGTVTGGSASSAARYHDALESSVSRHFDSNTVINCMCHTLENIYNWSNSAVARASDDFYPSDEASHYAHIAACAYNGLFLSPLVIPDYDMFQSNHASSYVHAVARAVSGGPVYVSDAPGKHDFSVLRKLVLPNGMILRAKMPCKPTIDCLFADITSDGKTALKLWTLNSFSAIIGVFHLQGSSWDREKRKFFIHDTSPRSISATISPLDVPKFKSLESCQFLISYQADEQEVWKTLRADQASILALTAGKAIAAQITPIYSLISDFCPVGLGGMLNAGGAILSMKFSSGKDDWKTVDDLLCDEVSVSCSKEISNVHMDIRGCGTFVAYCSSEPKECYVNSRKQDFRWTPDTGKLAIDLPSFSGDTKDPLICTVTVTL